MDELVDSNRIDSVLRAWPERWPDNAQWSYEPRVFYKPSDTYLNSHNNPDFAIVINAVEFSTQARGKTRRSGNGEYCTIKQLRMVGSAAVWDCRNNRPVILEQFGVSWNGSIYTEKCEFSRWDIKGYVKNAVFNSFYGTPLFD
jgi:hypothetical protein